MGLCVCCLGLKAFSVYYLLRDGRALWEERAVKDPNRWVVVAAVVVEEKTSALLNLLPSTDGRVMLTERFPCPDLQLASYSLYSSSSHTTTGSALLVS